MHKKVLEEKSIYFGKVSMPKGYEIDHESMVVDITGSKVYNVDFPVNKIWIELNTYLTERIYLNFKIIITNVKTWGELIYPGKKYDLITTPKNPKNHFVLIYGVKIEPRSTFIKICYNNRLEIHEIKEGEFIMFSSDFIYTFAENKSDNINYIQTILYERI